MSATINLTQAEGIAIQRRQLERWKRVLKPEMFERLQGEAQRHNSELWSNADGYNVWRGWQMDEFIQNTLMLLPEDAS